MQEAIGQLSSLGFTDSEARAYTHLLLSGPTTGYQLARLAAIPRPNVYPVLDRLEARRVVARIQGEGGLTLYSAMPAGQMLERLSSDVGRHLRDAKDAFDRLAPGAGTAETVWNLDGRAAVIARAAALIEDTKQELLAGLWAAEAGELRDALAALEARGVTPTVLCIQGCVDECGGCTGDVYRYAIGDGPRSRWLVISADGTNLLVAQLGEDGLGRGVHTRLEVLNGLAAGYLRNAIAAAEIVRSLGPNMASMVDARALSAIESAGLSSGGRTWLDRLLEATEAQERTNA
jgi:HTH-type transcriptional regulator, sugar sensing transcriptional regulator